MAAMTIDEAYRTLGIEKDATLREATKAYHELSKNMHPDISAQGSAEGQARLNEAHEVVVAFLQGGSASYLVPVEVKQAVQVLERGIARQEASRESEVFVGRVKSRHTRPIQQMKYIAFLMAGLAAFFGWASNDAGLGSFFDPRLLSRLKLIAITLGAAGGFMQFLVQHLTHTIEQFRDKLSDEDYCIAALKASGVNPDESFTPSELLNEFYRDGHVLNPVHVLFRSFDLSLSKRERLELALLKGLELGILERPENSRRRYQVTTEFRSIFK